ncbi:MAG TPA: tetratricopeptide repeat protein [Limnohabitans sp.]|uniref:tetratricopeptide repeat protein n=1 Tax=Limnohabitans sp. TaxID=1907725 RepID=UPI00269CE68F|nr:tetratricopeptide repeat protein [Limnohabitans sp.]HQR85221.1 tetratricopeptide repeat protein [Limnohabitans sp.]HQS27370.1 tetratricopeptide repeat protein [Limnohabitans sp.]
MTNPHALSNRMPLAMIDSFQLRTLALCKVHKFCFLTLGFSLLATISPIQAQSVDAEEWQPGQSLTIKKIASTPHNDVRKLLRQAKYQQALLLVNKNLATNPRDPQMRFWQGFIFEQMGQPDMALQVYLELTREFPELAEPFNNLGAIYAAKGDYPKAKAALDNALRANPNYAAAHENMGDLLVNMARQSYERSLTIEPKQSGISQKIEQIKPVLEITQGKP